MQDSVFNEDIGKLDFSKIAALQQKRTVAFINHFVLTNVQFLNNFIKLCEQKLMQFERKLEKVEAAMILLEAKLSSIPEVNLQPLTTHTSECTNTLVSDTIQSKSDAEENCDKESENKVNKREEPQIPPEYMRFLKMVQVGVPLEAVKLKASIEGLNPDVLQKLI